MNAVVEEQPEEEKLVVVNEDEVEEEIAVIINEDETDVSEEEETNEVGNKED